MKTTPATLLTLLLLASCANIEVDDFSFEIQDTKMTSSIRGLDVLNKSCVWISGAEGQYCFTTDEGSTWTKGTVPGASSLDFRDVEAFSEQSALLMSAGPGENSRIYRTDNGGNSWELCYQNKDSLGFFDAMDFLDDEEGILFSDPVDAKINLLRTSDGGRTWARLDPSVLPEMKTDEYAFAASGTSIMYDWQGGIWVVTGGSTARIWHAFSIEGPWEIFTPPSISGDPAAGLFSIDVLSDLHKAAVGGNYREMNLTGSNVVTWDDESYGWVVPENSGNLPFMECVKWLSANALLATGPPGVYFSNDKGDSWEGIYEGAFHTLDVDVKGNTGWLAGSQVQLLALRRSACNSGTRPGRKAADHRGGVGWSRR